MDGDGMIYKFYGQRTGTDAMNACDRKGRFDTDRLKPFKFARAALTFALVGAGGTSLRLGADATCRLFTAGVGEVGTDAGWDVLTESETDAGKEGAIVGANETFLLRAIGVYIEPGCRAAVGSVSVGPETVLYGKYAFAALQNSLVMSLQNGDEKSPAQNLGPVLMYPAQVRGREGECLPLGPGAMVGLTAEEPISEDGLIITLHSAREIDLLNDATVPTTASLTVPVRVVLYGQKA